MATIKAIFSYTFYAIGDVGRFKLIAPCECIVTHTYNAIGYRYRLKGGTVTKGIVAYTCNSCGNSDRLNFRSTCKSTAANRFYSVRYIVGRSWFSRRICNDLSHILAVKHSVYRSIIFIIRININICKRIVIPEGAVAYSRNLFGDGYGFKVSTPGKSVMSYLSKSFGQGDGCKRHTVRKGITAKLRYGRRNDIARIRLSRRIHDKLGHICIKKYTICRSVVFICRIHKDLFKAIAISKSILAYTGNTCRKFYTRKRIAIPERIVAYTCNSLRNVDQSKSAAFVEGVIAYGFNTIGNADSFKTGTTVKRLVAYTCNTIGDGYRRNFCNLESGFAYACNLFAIKL